MFSITGTCYRVWITCLNILFPPIAVMLIAGPGYDCIVNCCLFLLAVIPSHIHGFYISCVYFHRRHKVKKGQYPGGPKSFIQSKNVLNGGASDREVERLYLKEKGVSVGRSPSRSGSRNGGGMGRVTSKRSEMTQQRRDGSMLGKSTSVRSNMSQSGQGYSPVYDDKVARDGYGLPPQRMGSRRQYV